MDMAGVTLLTKEYPPYVYGGAGVHVDHLSKELCKYMRVEVRCFGDQNIREGNLKVYGYKVGGYGSKGIDQVLEALAVNLAMSRTPPDGEVVHCHTWYTLMAGFWIKELYGVPLVVTVHSLEPLRPWKQRQLGSAYRLSLWMEKTGVTCADGIIAVSREMKRDVMGCYGVSGDKVEVIYNGIDTTRFRPVTSAEALRKYNLDAGYVLFVGRVSEQKGIFYLIRAADYLPRGVKVVICAGASDTGELVSKLEEEAGRRENIILIKGMLPEEELVELYSHAAVFACPSVYEPFGIINLEAMACGIPVVASAVGGIKEVLVPGETGILVEPGNPVQLAEAIRYLVSNPQLRKKMGENGRRRVEELFSWEVIASQTRELYEGVKARTGSD